MLINCPNCNASYEVNPDIIPQNGRKLRCSSCREVFWCNPHDIENPAKKIDEAKVQSSESSLEEVKTESSDVFVSENNIASEESVVEENSISNESEENTNNQESANPQNDLETDNEEENIDDDINMQDIFQRLSMQSDEITQKEQKMNPVQKLFNKFLVMIGWHRKTNRIIISSVLGLFAILFLLFFRVEITRSLPFMNVIYSAIGLDAQIAGEGLEFSNVTRREYEVDDIPQMEIRGFIDNKTPYNVYADLLHVEVLDKDGAIVQQQNNPLPVQTFVPNVRVPFSVVIVKPSALGKYIVVTFAKKED